MANNPPANDDDTVPLQIRMGYQGKMGTPDRALIVDFGKSVTWLAFNKEQGLKFAEEFVKRLEGL